MRMQLTEAQYQILAAAAARGDDLIARGTHATESTLRSLAAHHIGDLQHEHVGRRRIVTGLEVSFTGWLIYTEEARRRDEAGRVEANARGARTVEADPFAGHAGSAQARREAAIDAAFA